MRRLFSFLVAIACLSTAHALTASAVTIELLPESRVHGDSVRLGQVAYVTATDIDTLRRLLALPLGHVPPTGRPVDLTREALKPWLRSKAGIAEDQITWKGASKVRVVAAAQELKGQELVNAAQAELQAWLTGRSERAVISPLSIPQDTQLPAGDIAIRPRPVDDSQPRKRMLVWVEVWVDSQFLRALPVSFEVEAYAMVPTARSGGGTGAPLDMDGVAGREVDLTKLRSPAWSGVTGDGMRLTKNVRAGQVIAAADVEAAPAVARGDWVMARSTAGSLSLESRVEVLQDGRLGQIVRVRQANANGAVMARVTGKGNVEIQQ